MARMDSREGPRKPGPYHEAMAGCVLPALALVLLIVGVVAALAVLG